MFDILGKIFLNSDARELSKELSNANVKGAEVVGRGTIVIDGNVIASSEEFRALQKQARQMVQSQHQVNQSA
ncbi:MULTISPECIES: hypothetical protein [Vibrio]|uniref:hypothetical protein n=1 Tax=Vibrio TaxID=662 RepID=UPI00096BC54C|nr:MULTISPECIES: hypothetical protein [Vibrio]EIT7145290.1 hypothetical protein [Vibrio vulnificus]EGR1860484.1 hypothetical protein [Vibrio cholerae]EHU0384974.1 hypothetical protein [Vibrio cholerae]EHV2409885.1 hypothetical protein [Vibrio cholerae]EHY8704357.1 hypothetical protein [Vibrio cholerae]